MLRKQSPNPRRRPIEDPILPLPVNCLADFLAERGGTRLQTASGKGRGEQITDSDVAGVANGFKVTCTWNQIIAMHNTSVEAASMEKTLSVDKSVITSNLLPSPVDDGFEWTAEQSQGYVYYG